MEDAMATKKIRDSRFSLTAQKGWFVIKIEAPLKLVLAIASIIATALGYPTIVEVAMKLLVAK